MTRLVVLAGTDRLPPGLLPGQVWALLPSVRLFTADPGHPQREALAAAGVAVDVVENNELWARAAGYPDHATLGWLAGANDADLPDPPAGGVVEVWDVPGLLPGAALLELVATMDRLRSPGGCPWDAEQTHESLAPHLLEEAYEAVHAIEEGDLAGLREEIGDVLLQVVFHARLAEEGAQPFDIDDVAEELVAKLVRRHPHVFADVAVAGAADVVENWEAIKAREKARKSVTEGLPLALPALALAETLQRRAERLGAPLELTVPRLAAGEQPAAAVAAAAVASNGSPEDFGELLFTVVAFARSRGVDPERALRGANRAFRDRLANFEYAVRERGEDPAAVGHEEWHRLWAASS